jgi:hypothetical protein
MIGPEYYAAPPEGPDIDVLGVDDMTGLPAPGAVPPSFDKKADEEPGGLTQTEYRTRASAPVGQRVNVPPPGPRDQIAPNIPRPPRRSAT